MKLREKTIFAVLSVFCFILISYLAKEVITPFICSLVISYFLNPVVIRFCERDGISRLKATALIMGLFFAILISLSFILLPTIYSQLASLIEALPGYFKIFNEHFYPKIYELASNLGFEMNTDLATIANKPGATSNILDFSTNLLNNAVNSSFILLNAISFIFIMPFLIFYLLKDWELMTAKVSDYLPHEKSSVIRKILKEIDDNLSGYVRGQINVCLILGTIYSILLSFTGLNFGFIIGFLTGLLSFIPFVGMLIGVTVAITVTLFQWGFDISQISLIALVFILGQIIESNFLTPKLIGSKIGLHPVWMIFSLFFFGDLLGFIGILIAIPLAAICSVIIKNLAIEYKRRFVDAS